MTLSIDHELDAVLNTDNKIVLAQEKLNKYDICTVKTPGEISKMCEAGQIAGLIFDEIGERMRPGITGRELNAIAFDPMINKIPGHDRSKRSQRGHA